MITLERYLSQIAHTCPHSGVHALPEFLFLMACGSAFSWLFDQCFVQGRAGGESETSAFGPKQRGQVAEHVLSEAGVTVIADRTSDLNCRHMFRWRPTIL